MELERPQAAQIATPIQNLPYQSWGSNLGDRQSKQSRPAPVGAPVRSSPAPLRRPFIAAQNNSTPVNRGTVFFFECVAGPLLCGTTRNRFHPGYSKINPRGRVFLLASRYG